MKKLALAIVAGLALGACATMDNGNGASARALPAAGTQYCWQDRLTTAAGKHTCNWSANRRDACESASFTTVEAGRYTAPRKASLCANGQWLVEVAPAG